MRAKKFIAIIAVLAMLVVPFVSVVANEYSTTEGAVIPDASTSTHIELSDLDQAELKTLFGIKGSDLTDVEVSKKVAQIVAAVLFPGLNPLAIKTSNNDFAIDGVDIQIDYIRDVRYGQSVDTAMAIQVNIRSASISFETYGDMYMLASEAYAAAERGELPKAYLDDQLESKAGAAEAAIKEIIYFGVGVAAAVSVAEEKSEVLTAIASYPKQYDELESSLGIPNKIISMEDKRAIAAEYEGVVKVAQDETKTLDDVRTAGYGFLGYVTKLVYTEDASGQSQIKPEVLDAVQHGLVLTEYKTMLKLFTLIETIHANGDYANGIKEAYSGKCFVDGQTLTMKLASSVTFYFDSAMVVKEIDSVEWDPIVKASCPAGSKAFAITGTGLNFGRIIEIIANLVGGATPFFDENVDAILPDNIRQVLRVLEAMPVTDFALDAKFATAIEYMGEKTGFTSHTDIDTGSTVTFDYADDASMFNKWKDRNFTMNVVDAHFSIHNCHSVVVKGVEYEAASLDLDLTDEIEEYFDEMQGITDYYIDKTMFDPTDVEYYSMFGIIVDPAAQGILHFMSELPFKYTYLTNLFKGKEVSALNDSMDEAAAKRTIESVGGYCSHERADAVEGLKEIHEDLNPEEPKADNSATILWIAVIVIVILAIIGFGAILWKAKRN